MRIVKQGFSLPIFNHDIQSPNRYQKHAGLFGGHSKRCLIVGSSGSGKTNVMITLLVHPRGLRFENLYIYSKSLYQPKYEYLRDIFKPLKNIGYYEYDEGEEIIPPSQVKPNSVMIFDDIVCCNQSPMRDYFSFGRHREADCFYLSQTYSSIPKQLIRDNTNLIIIFRQDQTNLKHIYEDHVTTDMLFQKFKDLCALCWEDEYGFVVIDKDCEMRSGRYRKGFDSYIYL